MFVENTERLTQVLNNYAERGNTTEETAKYARRLILEVSSCDARVQEVGTTVGVTGGGVITATWEGKTRHGMEWDFKMSVPPSEGLFWRGSASMNGSPTKRGANLFQEGTSYDAVCDLLRLLKWTEED